MKFLKTYQNDFKGNEHYRITSKKKVIMGSDENKHAFRKKMNGNEMKMDKINIINYHRRRWFGYFLCVWFPHNQSRKYFMFVRGCVVCC